MSNIHNYPVESLTFSDDDFYDIDFYNGVTYETRKIKGLTIRNGIQALLETIYNADGTLTSNRVLDGNSNTFRLSLNDLLSLNVSADVDGGDNIVFNIKSPQTLPTDYGFKIRDVSSGNTIFGVRDGGVEINGEFILPLVDGTDGQIIKTNGSGSTEFVSTQDLESVNFGSTQWSKTIVSPVSLLDGTIANGCTFFTNADKSASGTTTYDEFNIAYGLSITLTGTSGTANVSFDGGVTNYLATFNTSLYQTAVDFVSTHETALNTAGIRIFALGSGADGRLRFCSSEATLNAMTITNVTTDLSGTIANEFTGDVTAQPDHILVPYVGTAYEGQRIHHNFRVNFGIVTGSSQTLGLSLRRYENDSIIGSELQVNRTQDVEGIQSNFISYTAGASDPFVLGGFYFALRNDSGVVIEITSGIGILIQNYYQKLTQF